MSHTRNCIRYTIPYCYVRCKCYVRDTLRRPGASLLRIHYPYVACRDVSIIEGIFDFYLALSLKTSNRDFFSPERYQKNLKDQRQISSCRQDAPCDNSLIVGLLHKFVEIPSICSYLDRSRSWSLIRGINNNGGRIFSYLRRTEIKEPQSFNDELFLSVGKLYRTYARGLLIIRIDSCANVSTEGNAREGRPESLCTGRIKSIPTSRYYRYVINSMI